ncbi:MAG: squalene/phytoene synthase family protein [Elusimicrobiota bacterium]|jgi:farnesyl-diphosphate farnesyltransferase
MTDTERLLRDVSRSFHLSLRVLPKPVRAQVGLAYLLARASDTVADTQAVPRERRRELLERMRKGDYSSVGALAKDQALPAERMLLERLGECAARRDAFGARDREFIAQLLDVIVTGQLFDLERFPEGTVTALRDDAELDRYTYLVAGCVGEFWTRICAEHLPAFAALDQAEMYRLGVRFGKGLQLVNVLRDTAADLRIGRCYLPVAKPELLLDPARNAAFAAEYRRWLDAALDHLDAGWRYTLNIPRSLKRLRLACVWPIWLGLETIALLRRANPLDPAQRVMVPQGRVYLMLARSALSAGSDRLLNGAYQTLRRRALAPAHPGLPSPATPGEGKGVRGDPAR